MAVLTRPLVHAPFAVALALVFVAACHGDAHNEPTPASPAASVTAPAPTRPVGRQTHRIVPQDHRHVLAFRVDDLVLLPDDPAFEWKIEFEDKSAATQATDIDAGGEAYRVTKTGPVRVMVFGDPKVCMHSDAACTVSKRRWDITFAVN